MMRVTEILSGWRQATVMDGGNSSGPMEIVTIDSKRVTLRPAYPASGLPKKRRRVNSLFVAVPQFMRN